VSSFSAPPLVPEGAETADTAPRALAHLAVGFAAELRDVGLRVPLAAVTVFRAALGEVAGFEPHSLYWAGRSIFVHGPDDVALYDRAYGSFFLHQLHHAGPTPVIEARPNPDSEVDGDDPPIDDSEDTESLLPGATVWERLSNRDFAELSGAELAMTHRLMAEIAFRVPHRVTRRRVASGPGGASFDLRTTVRRAQRTGGDVLVLEERHRKTHPRRLVAICDISGSMDPYARELVRFLHVCVAGRPEVEAFALGTRLTRVTRQLSGHDADTALRHVAEEVPDWAGGTRLGEGIRAFNDRYGIRGMARGAIVLVCSDGIDRGDPELLSSELERLARVAARIIWVNPLKAMPGYAPTARGMAAALPHLDAFLPGHSLEAFVAVARSVAV
jgi:uncharacterized protein with von Willebrand factor type A (vWA) domain